MKPKYLNNLIEESYSLFTRMKSGIRKAGLVALAGVMIGVGVYGCKKEEPKKEDISPTESVEQIEQEPGREGTLESVSLEGKLYKQTKIAFVSDRDRHIDIIYVMNADGSEQKRLINPARGRGYSWSPDGKKIVFGNLYIINTDGSEQKRLINFSSDSQHSLSPDGKKIAFVSTRDGNFEIYVMNADGTDQKNLTNNLDTRPYRLHWSPDGKKIAFISYPIKGEFSEIYVVNADGSGLKRLTNNPASDGSPSYSWSPDAKKIAFVSDRDGNYEIYVMNADGSGQKRLTNNPVIGAISWSIDWSPSWSPDGKKIAFDSKRDRNWEIYVMNADGSEQKNLTNNPASDGFPSWSPDGRKIAFESDRDGNREIYVMNADGTEQKNLTNNPSDDEDPSWSPFLPLENKN